MTVDDVPVIPWQFIDGGGIACNDTWPVKPVALRTLTVDVWLDPVPVDTGADAEREKSGEFWPVGFVPE